MKIISWAQLVRLPNVFTVHADVLMAWAVVTATHGWAVNDPSHAATLAVMLGASTCFYWAGMVLNDYFDREEDLRDRPHRPLPSGRIQPRSALAASCLLLAIGLGLAVVVSVDWTSHTVWWAVALAALIVGYDAWLKHTPAGFLAMAACRSCNVLMVCSVGPWAYTHLAVAGVVGGYIAGVTIFAKTEAERSSRTRLSVAAVVIAAALVVGATLPLLAPNAVAWPLAGVAVLAAWLLWLGRVMLRAINVPEPRRVQSAVKTAILGLIVVDAGLATIFVGPSGLGIGLLLIPAVWLGRRLYST